MPSNRNSATLLTSSSVMEEALTSQGHHSSDALNTTFHRTPLQGMRAGFMAVAARSGQPLERALDQRRYRMTCGTGSGRFGVPEELAPAAARDDHEARRVHPVTLPVRDGIQAHLLS